MKPRWMALACSWAFLVGCDRAHLSEGYGRATRGAFAAQVLDPRAGATRKPEPGLDPEEAASVAQTYRRTISSSPDTVKTPQVLVLDPKAAPAPSVEAK